MQKKSNIHIGKEKKFFGKAFGGKKVTPIVQKLHRICNAVNWLGLSFLDLVWFGLAFVSISSQLLVFFLYFIGVNEMKWCVFSQLLFWNVVFCTPFFSIHHKHSLSKLYILLVLLIIKKKTLRNLYCNPNTLKTFFIYIYIWRMVYQQPNVFLYYFCIENIFQSIFTYRTKCLWYKSIQKKSFQILKDLIASFLQQYYLLIQFFLHCFHLQRFDWMK